MTTSQKRLAGAAAIVMVSLVVSRITGFMRSALIANVFTKIESDALLTAFRMTDILYNLLLGGAISAALIPVLSGYIARKQEEEGWRAVSSFINLVFGVMVVAACLGVVFSPQLIDLIAPGLHEDSRLLAIRASRILFPSVSFMMLVGMLNGVLNSYQRFAAAAFGPSVYNLGVVVSIYLLEGYGVDKVAIGVLSSAILYFLMQLVFASRNLHHYRPRIYFREAGFRNLFMLAVPSLVSSSIVQINVQISLFYVSFFREGSITSYNNANEVWQLPWGIFAMGMGTALLPTLSEKLAVGELDIFKNILQKGLKTVLLLTVPSGIALIVLRVPIISAIYKWSANMDTDRIHQTGMILVFFSIALFAQSVLAIVNRAFYADNDTRTPLYVGAFSILLNAGFCYLMFRTTQLEAAGVSLGYSLQSIVNMIILVYIFNRRIKGLRLDKLGIFVAKIGTAAVVMGGVLWYANGRLPVDFSAQFSMAAKVMELLYLALEVALGAGVYFLLVYLFKVEEIEYVRSMLSGKLGRFLRKPAKK